MWCYFRTPFIRATKTILVFCIMAHCSERSSQYVRDTRTGRWRIVRDHGVNDAVHAVNEYPASITAAQQIVTARQHVREQAQQELQQRKGNATAIKALIAERRRRAAQVSKSTAQGVSVHVAFYPLPLCSAVDPRLYGAGCS